MIKLPKKKYVPIHNNELSQYAVGWNATIEDVKYMHNNKKYDDERIKKDLFKSQEYNSKRKEMAYFNGVYDCIIEIEKLNEEESDHRLDNFFQDGLDALDKLNIRSEQKKADELADEEFLEHGFICGYSVKDLLLFAYACRRQGITENQLQDYRLTFEEVYKIVLAEVKDITKKLGEEK